MGTFSKLAVTGAEESQDIDALAFEIARNRVGMNLPIEELLTKLHVTPEHFLRLSTNDSFKKAVKAYTKELEENGVSFQLRAAIIAEEGLKQLDRIIHDLEEPGSTRLKAIEKAVEWGNLAPRADHLQAGNSAPTIVFNFPEGLTLTKPATALPATDVEVVAEQ